MVWLLLLCCIMRAGYNCSASWGPLSNRQTPLGCTSQVTTDPTYATPALQLMNINDRDKLRTIKAAWGHPAMLASWDLFDMPCGSPGWQWVECSWQGRVSRLNLSDSSLAGALPPELGQLSALEVLDLSRNSFSGPLPDFYSQLRVLDFSLNKLTGPLPVSWRYLSSLKSLDLSFNTLEVSTCLAIATPNAVWYLVC